MAEFEETVEFPDSRCVRATSKAILVEIPDFGGEFWIPQTQVDDRSEVYGAAEGENVGTLVVSQWIAEEKGLTGSGTPDYAGKPRAPRQGGGTRRCLTTRICPTCDRPWPENE